MATKKLKHFTYPGETERAGFVRATLGDTQLAEAPALKFDLSLRLALFYAGISRGLFKPRLSCLKFTRKKTSEKLEGLLKSILIEELLKSTSRREIC